MNKKERYAKIIEYFTHNMPKPETELHFENPYQLIVAVILSAQCTDKRVNMITPALYKKFPTAEMMAKSSESEIFELIKSCSYPNNKAKNLLGMAKTLTNDFKGIVPEDIEELQKLPGVGRKTANVVASVVFRKEVMAVDTHVFRVAARIGLSTNAGTPLETEKQLVSHIPSHHLPDAHHWLILHGRYICKARTPLCQECGIKSYCLWYNKNHPIS